MLATREDKGTQSSHLPRIKQARANTDHLFELVRSEYLYERPIAERHRIIFYIGHLEAFDWNLLRGALPGLEVFDAALDRLFAFGIDPIDGQLPSDRPEDWPGLSAVHEYRRKIRESLDAALQGAAELPGQLLNVAVEHRLMHAETLAYMLHQLPLEQKRQERQVAVPEPGAPEFRGIAIPSGAVTLGQARSEFGWDNEYEAHRVEVPAFEIDRYKITNGQYLEFVHADGYNQRRWWRPEAWEWKAQQQIRHPAFWKPELAKTTGRGWIYKTMFEEIGLPLNWPVYVSHAEASAYAAWAGRRLPSETEWQRAAYGTTTAVENAYPWGRDEPAPRHGYFDFTRWDPPPVNASPENRSAFGVEGLLASGWEWTATPFAPFPGFRPFPFYPGYSANFFDRLHYVMKGGSTRTDKCMLRRSFRNWFQPHYQYVYAGFRCVSK